MHQHRHNPCPISIPDTLRAGGFRVTATKVKLLDVMQKAGVPLSIQEILSHWTNSPPNQTTLYRSLTDLVEAGIAKRVDLNTGIAHFEYTPNRPHHHHLVCTNCGMVEEIGHCKIGGLEKRILGQSPHFSKITDHNLEFFGLCVSCINN